MAEKLEQIFGNLLVPDTAVIQQATVELKQLMKDPAMVPALCTVLATSQTPQVRQYAAVLLRRRVLRKKQWDELPPDITENIRGNLLQVLLQEPEKSVRKSLAQLCATVAKHDLPEGKWADLFQFFQTYTSSEKPEQRELGMYVLSVVSSGAAQQLLPYIGALVQLCAGTLQDTQGGHMVPFYTIQTLTCLVEVIGTDQMKAFQALIPPVLQVIQGLVTIDEDLATEALEIFDELVECEVAIIVPHIKSIIEFCLQLGANRELGNKLRVKALSFVSWIVRLKKKSIMKLRLVHPILNTLFPILCEAPKEGEEDEDEDEDFDEAESHTAPTYATQVIDVMALHLPPEKVIPPLMKHIEPALTHSDPYHRKGGYLAMAVAAEGCADHMRTKYLKTLLQCVYKGLNDPSPVVRNAALFALGQFSEQLQPDISKYSSELLPLLFECLTKASADITKDPRGVTKTYYALEMFCENLEKDILPYLPQLMQYLMCALTSNTSPHVKELAISAIGAAANAAKEELVPYFGQIIETLKVFLTPATQEEAHLKIQVQALDTLGVLARTLGEHFRPLAAECLQLGLTLLSDATDPDLRRCCYGLFAALSTLLKTELAPHLQSLVSQMITSIKSTEGVQAHYEDEESRMFQMFDDEAEENIEGSDEESEEIQGYSVGNSYLEEKGDACCALGELSLNTGSAFMAYMEECFKETLPLLDYPATELREGAITAVGQFCCAVAQQDPSPDAQTALFTMLTTVVPKLLTIVAEDEDRQVATVTLDQLKEMLDKIGAPVIQCLGGSPDKILITVKLVMQEKAACQDSSVDELAGGDAEEDDEKSEFDTILMENAGDIIPTLAKVLGGAAFAPYFAGFLPDLLKRMKKTSTVAERSFAVGTIGETVHALGPAAVNFAPTLLPLLMGMMGDEDEEVRSNAVFAVGVVAANGGECMYANYPHILKALLELLSRESDRRTVDNICASVCRLIMTRTEAVPLPQVLPLVVGCLPLVEDLEENETVYNCLCELYKTQPQDTLPFMPQVIAGVAHVLTNPPVKDGLQAQLVGLLRDLQLNHADSLQQVLGSLPEATTTKLQQLMAA